MAGLVSGGIPPYSAQINWGDGSTESGAVSGSTVTGQHTYSDIGSYTSVITVTDSVNTQTSDSITFNVLGNNATISIPSLSVWGMVGTAIGLVLFFIWRAQRRQV